jgi:hypothetical protein
LRVGGESEPEWTLAKTAKIAKIAKEEKSV